MALIETRNTFSQPWFHWDVKQSTGWEGRGRAGKAGRGAGSWSSGQCDQYCKGRRYTSGMNYEVQQLDERNHTRPPCSASIPYKCMKIPPGALSYSIVVHLPIVSVLFSSGASVLPMRERERDEQLMSSSCTKLYTHCHCNSRRPRQRLSEHVDHGHC